MLHSLMKILISRSVNYTEKIRVNFNLNTVALHMLVSKKYVAPTRTVGTGWMEKAATVNINTYSQQGQAVKISLDSVAQNIVVITKCFLILAITKADAHFIILRFMYMVYIYSSSRYRYSCLSTDCSDGFL